MSAVSRTRVAPTLRAVCAKRCLHTSVPAAAKKRGKEYTGDIFGVDGGGGGPRVRESYTFGQGSSAPQGFEKAAKEDKPKEKAAAAKEEDLSGLTPFARLRRRKFNEQMEFARKHLRSKVHWERKLVRHGALRQLAALADTPEQLRNVAALFPDWARCGYTLDDDTATTYIGRCISLGRPQIAVTLLLNGHKHKFNLPSLPAARKLLQALIGSGTSTLRNTLSYAAIYTAYHLPPAAEDPASCAMLIDACLKAGTPDALKVAEEFAKLAEAARLREREGAQSTRVEKTWRARLDGLSASVHQRLLHPPPPADAPQQARAS
ncbi:hypothetical protein AURDEDRAFT_184420 [Auricularia subglabra TFB-10046 SS5]|nr:hypothetical protein AURDEDRAFT_184420 [Auricularia subglabra TFB-10046 SS5]